MPTDCEELEEYDYDSWAVAIDDSKRPINNDTAKQFITAGKACFTISVPLSYRVALDERESLACVDWYTYKVKAKTDDNCYRCKGTGCAACGNTGEGQTTYFVSLLSGPDNWTNYVYMGILNPKTGVVRLTNKSKYRPTTPPYRILNGILERVWQGHDLPKGFELRHEGKCGRCGRKLTVPESIDRGFGPDCWGRLAHGVCVL